MRFGARHWLWALASVCCTLACGDVGPFALPFPGQLPGTSIGQNLPLGYEPSGGAWHTRLRKVFLVGDGGTVSSMDSNGNGVNNWSVPGDLEGIAVAKPETNLVYVGVESPEAIKEFNFVTGAVTRTFSLRPWMRGGKNSGLEALVFVPDLLNPEGGLFYAGLQSEGAIYVFQLPITSSVTSTQVTYLRKLTPAPGRKNLSSLDWDWTPGILYAVWSKDHLLSTMTRDGLILAEYELPGNAQEGIAFPAGAIIVMEDTGRVMRYSWLLDHAQGGFAASRPPQPPDDFARGAGTLSLAAE